jgi:hypothetical protein
MTFQVVLLSEEQSKQLPPISKLLLDRTEPALLISPRTQMTPIILFCDEITGRFPGAKPEQTAYLLNETAWEVCGGLSLKGVKTIGDAELPPKYGLLIGPASASSDRRKFQ